MPSSKEPRRIADRSCLPIVSISPPPCRSGLRLDLHDRRHTILAAARFSPAPVPGLPVPARAFRLPVLSLLARVRAFPVSYPGHPVRLAENPQIAKEWLRVRARA